jgi:hypothetical protein
LIKIIKLTKATVMSESIKEIYSTAYLTIINRKFYLNFRPTF